MSVFASLSNFMRAGNNYHISKGGDSILPRRIPENEIDSAVSAADGGVTTEWKPSTGGVPIGRLENVKEDVAPTVSPVSWPLCYPHNRLGFEFRVQFAKKGFLVNFSVPASIVWL